GKLNSIEIAIFQHKQVNSSSEMNEQDLHAEMEVAVLAQYLLDSFYCHGEGLGLKLPVIKWNLPFFGTLLDHSAVADINTLHSRSLLWKDFLVAPLLIIGGEYKEIKFSGTEDFSPNTNVIGQTIDAYVHHTLIDSGGTLLLADVQGVLSPQKELTLFDPQGHSFLLMVPHKHIGIKALYCFVNTSRIMNAIQSADN
ncbi:hypothetical protein BDQ12DRAFT_672161, partial [Crucibulum laeve]